MTSADALTALLASARGLRPASLHCVEAEHVLNATLALAVELSVANARIANLERQLAQYGQTTLAAIRTPPPSAEAEAERQQASEALMLRLLHTLLDGRTMGSPSPAQAL